MIKEKITQMSNLLFLYESVEPTNQETFDLVKLASITGGFGLRKRACLDVRAEDIEWCDVVLSVRSTSDMEWRLAKMAKSLGKYWILMLDDDFLSLGDDYGRDGQGYRNELKHCLKRLLYFTDCLLTVNELLAKKYASLGKIKKYVLSSASFDSSNMTEPTAGNKKTKIVYYVNDGTETMFDLYLKPLLHILCQKYSDQVALYFLSIRPEMSEYEDKIETHYIPHMSLDEFWKYVANEHFDIGLAPLDEIGFSKYKYFNKYVEYTRAGIAGIYSDCALYRQVVENGYNGVLCDNSTECWIRAISELIDNKDKRVMIAKNAQRYAIEHFSKNKVIDKLLEDIPELTQYSAPKKKVSHLALKIIWIHYWGFRVRGWIHTIYCCIKTGNIKALIRRAKEKFQKG